MSSQRPDPSQIPDLPGTLDAFAAAWTVLARLFAEAPDQARIDAVRAMAQEWPLSGEVPATRRGVRLLTRSAEDAESAEAVHRDVQRLFTGPGHLEAPPYESVHLNRSGLVFEEETLAVRAFYRRFGLRLENQGREPDDHVAIELEMLATLALRALDEIDATAAGDAPQDGPAPEPALPEAAAALVDAIGEFLEDHALLWHHRLGELSVEKARTSFVQAMGSLLMGASIEAGDVFAADVDLLAPRGGAATDTDETDGAAGAQGLAGRRGRRMRAEDTSNAAAEWAEADARTRREIDAACTRANSTRNHP